MLSGDWTVLTDHWFTV